MTDEKEEYWITHVSQLLDSIMRIVGLAVFFHRFGLDVHATYHPSRPSTLPKYTGWGDAGVMSEPLAAPLTIA